MSNLLTANFIRLKKNKLFWTEMLAMFLFAIVIIGNHYREHIKYGLETSLDNVLFGYAVPIGMVMAVFISIFLGTEYSDGTIRNKVIIGHFRMNIYFANLITNIAASFFMCLSFLLAVITVGIPLIDFAETDTISIVKMLLGTLVLAVAFCSIFTMIGMIYSNTAAVSVINILLVIAIFLFIKYITSMLNAPKYLDAYIVGSTGISDYPNPRYITGVTRSIFEFLFDFLPTGQSIQYAGMVEVKHLHFLRLPLYSLMITIVTTFVGVTLFKRKDIK